MSDHLSEDELVLHHYGESPDTTATRGHLAGCEACRTSYEALSRVLAAVSETEVPARGPDYGRQVWEGLRGRLDPRPARVLRFPRRFVAATAIAASLVFAFLLGRAWQPAFSPTRVASEPISAPAREKILLIAVGEHLERSQMVLVELQNARAEDGVDITSERRWASELVPANRLYRQAALRAGEPGVASVLEDLERVLVEVAASPDRLTPAAFEEIRQRIESQGILFKVRIIGSQVRERQQSPQDPNRRTS
jgi:hypothetical protein